MKPITALALTILTFTSVFAQGAQAEPFLSEDEISSLTLTPEEYEEKYDEPIEPADYESDDNGGTCGLSSQTQAARDFITSMLGPWNMVHNAGYVSMAGMTMPYPSAGGIDRVNFERVGNTLVMTHVDMQSPMVFKWPNEGDWAWGEDLSGGKPAPGISSDDLELVMGCSLSDMPRLIGHSTISMDGAIMNFTYRIVVLNGELITGIMHLNGSMDGYQFFSARTVTLSR